MKINTIKDKQKYVTEKKQSYFGPLTNHQQSEFWLTGTHVSHTHLYGTTPAET